MPGADRLEPIVNLTDAPTAEEEHAVGSGLARFNEQQSGISDSRPLAVVVRDPQTKQPVGGLTGRTSLGLLFIDLFFLPNDLRGDGLGSRLLRLAEDEARQRGCVGAVLYTINFQGPIGTERGVGRCLPGDALGAPGCVIGGHPFNVRFPVGGNPMKMARPLSLVVVTVWLFAAVPTGAQQPVAPPPPQIPYGAPINFEQAKKVMAGAEAEATKNKWNMVIAVLDSGGHVVMLHRLDGTQLGSIDAAKDKAYSAVLYRRPTKVFQDLVGQGGPNLRLLKLSGASPLEGGIPLMMDGKIIGAVGVSGATSEQDAQVAKAGADALTK